MQIVCPSGLAGEIRKLKVKEENILADTKRMRNGTGLNDVLRNIWISTTNKGPYKFDDVPDFGNVLMGDHFYATIYMRIASRGSDYAFKASCTNQFCQAPFEWELDLLNLPVQKLSDESRNLFVNGNKFETDVLGRKVTFQLLTAKTSQRFTKIRRERPSSLVTASLRLQILEVEGVPKLDLDEWLEDLDSDVADELRSKFDDAGCGIETTIMIECPECGSQFEIELPFGSRDFFSRRRKKTEAAGARSQI